MTPTAYRKKLPLLVDSLPLYAHKDQIVAAITSDAREQTMARVMFDWRGFPRPSALLGGLYFVPAVVEFIDQYESQRQATGEVVPEAREKATCEPTPTRRGLRGEREPAALKFRTG
jgi:hypothetical protein